MKTRERERERERRARNAPLKPTTRTWKSRTRATKKNNRERQKRDRQIARERERLIADADVALHVKQHRTNCVTFATASRLDLHRGGGAKPLLFLLLFFSLLLLLLKLKKKEFFCFYWFRFFMGLKKKTIHRLQNGRGSLFLFGRFSIRKGPFWGLGLLSIWVLNDRFFWFRDRTGKAPSPLLETKRARGPFWGLWFDRFRPLMID